MNETNGGRVDDAVSMEREVHCENCGSLNVVEGYKINFCPECREKFSRYPLPLWIKGMAGIIFIIMLSALVFFPKSLRAGIAFERGQRAERNRKFATAAKEYKKVVDAFPNSFIAEGKLFVAYVKNDQLDEAEKIFQAIKGTKSKDTDEKAIIEEANQAILTLNAYYDVKEGLAAILKAQDKDEPATSLQKLTKYTKENPNEYFGFYYLGDALFDLGKYKEAEAAYSKAVQLKPNMSIGRLSLAAAYRQAGEFDKAIDQCNQVLKTNEESAYAYASLCKIDIKRHQYKSAMELAKKAYILNPEDITVLETVALADHFNNLPKEREKVCNLLKEKKDPYLDRLQQIFSGESKIYE